ncbi:MAG: porin [Gammaproteobacteria bacterium]|nr:MAG: porin [Gammaproteobacteria bacterium]
MKHAAPLSLIAGALMASNAALADISFNGFATIAGGLTSSDKETYAGYDKDLTFEPDTLVGLQANADLDDGFGATLQLLARGSEDYNTEAEWAYVSYDVSPAVRVNAGRQRIPFYMYSDFLDVGYAYSWVRPPEGFYSSPVTSFDGLSLLYSRYIQDVEFGLQAVAGSFSDSEIRGTTGTYAAELKNYAGLVLSGTWEAFTVRLTYHKADGTLSGGSLFTGMAGASAAVASSLPDLARKLDITRDNFEFMGVGASYDNGSLVLVSEARKLNFGDNLIPDEQVFYASAGYRLDALTPYVLFERADSTTEDAALNQMVTVLGATGQALAEGVEFLARNSSTYSVGVRYDFHPAAAAKFELSRIDDHRPAATTSAGVTGQDVDLLRVAVDVVF